MNKEAYKAAEKEFNEAIQAFTIGDKQTVSRLNIAARRHTQAEKWREKEEIRRGYTMDYWTEEGGGESE